MEYKILKSLFSHHKSISLFKHPILKQQWQWLMLSLQLKVCDPGLYFAVSTENSVNEVKIAFAKNAVNYKMEKLDNPTFGFDFTSYEETVKQVNNLKRRKVSQKTDIPVKIFNKNIDIVSCSLYHNFNNTLSCSTFPTCMKYAVTLIHKKWLN